jgi:hypothetical protein
MRGEGETMERKEDEPVNMGTQLNDFKCVPASLTVSTVAYKYVATTVG